MEYDKEIVQKIRDISISSMLGVKIYGRRLGIPCPFHNGKSSTSFYLDNKNGFHCFKCGAHGNNFIDFLKQKGYKFEDIYNEFKNDVI